MSRCQGVALSDFGKVVNTKSPNAKAADDNLSVKCQCDSTKNVFAACDGQEPMTITYEPSSDESKCETPLWVFDSKKVAPDSSTLICEGQFRAELMPPENIAAGIIPEGMKRNANTNIMCGGVETPAWDLFSLGKLVSVLKLAYK